MVSTPTILAATTLFVAATASTSGVVGLDFTKSKALARDFPHLTRRQSGTVLAALDNVIVLYAINVSFHRLHRGQQ